MKKKILLSLFIFVILLLNFRMFLMMTNGVINSDFPAHISLSLDGKYYSFVGLLTNAIIRNGGNNWLISMLMVLFIVVTILFGVVSIKIISKVIDAKFDTYECVLLSATSIFICKICIPDLSPYYYADTLVTQPLHNSTYIAMRMLGLITMAVYFTIQKDYLNKLERHQLIIFTVLIFLVNFAKPNFIVGFAPIMLAVLIKDFIKTKTSSFKNAFIFGICVLIGCVVLIPQYLDLYPSDGGVSTTVSINNFVTYFMANKKLPLNLFMNLAFPIYVAYLSYINRDKLSKTTVSVLVQTWCMYVLSLMQFFFIRETGIRSTDMNFRWGEQFFGYALFVISACVLKKIYSSKVIGDKEYTIANYTYALHIIFGLCYFLLVAGLGYFYLEI